MSDIVVMLHGRPTQGAKRWVNGRLSREQAQLLHDRLGEALAQEEFEDFGGHATVVHANAEIATGTTSVKVSQMGQHRT